MNSRPSNIRIDLKLIADLIEPNSKVLDVGCGDGELLNYLVKEKGIKARGIEISTDGVKEAFTKGLSVMQGDADTDLKDYPSNMFDFVVLSDTLQAMRNPKETMAEMLRIGKNAIVSIPNFGHWSVRFNLMFNGKMPVTKDLPYSWYETPNIHFCTIKDFVNLCKEMNVIIKQGYAIDSNSKIQKCNAIGSFANFFALNAVFLLSRK